MSSSVIPAPPPARVRIPAGTTASQAVGDAGLPRSGPEAVVVVRDEEGRLRDLSWAPESEVEVEGTTVGEALDAVFDAHDGLRERITQDGDLRRFVNVYVSGEDIRFQDGLETEVNEGDEVTILPAVAGG